MTFVRKALLSLVGAITLVLGMVLSQESVSAFSVSPMKQPISLVPGQTYSNKVSVSLPLDDDKNMYYEVSVEPFMVDDKDNNYHIDLSRSDEHNEIVKWVSLSDGVNTVESGDALTGELAPGKVIDFIYTINVPKTVVGGGQYFAVLVKSIPAPSDDTNNNLSINEIKSIASVVYVDLPGEVKLDGTLRENRVNGFLLNPPITASFVAENKGNTHLEVTYYLQVYPLFSDEEVYTNEEDPATDYVLPGTSRYISQTWDKTPSVGIFKVKQTAYYNSEGDESGKSVTERIVIVCPIYLLFLIIFVIVSIAIWIVFRVRSRKKSR